MARPAPRPLRGKIKGAPALARLLARERKGKGKRPRVVFTNGCFDLLHKGHVTYLQQARRLGDLLVVALNSDESVRRLKGPERPLNDLAARLEVMASLESVDFVTWFGDDTPLELIRGLKPDILVKGGDWKPEQIVGSAEVLGRGGKVRSLPYLEGHSTTSLIKRAAAKRG